MLSDCGFPAARSGDARPQRHPPGWSKYAWFDGLFPDRIDVTALDALEVPGTFLWVEGQEYWWLEPGFASVALAPGTQLVTNYALRFGDASKGLTTAPYQERRAAIWVAPSKWLYEFVGPRCALRASEAGDSE